MKLFNPGQIVKTTGLDMGVTEIDIEVEFVEYLDVRTYTGFDCVIIDDGIRVLCNSDELHHIK